MKRKVVSRKSDVDGTQLVEQRSGHVDGDHRGFAGAEPAGHRGDIQVIARVAALLERVTATSPLLDAQIAAEVLGVGRSSAHRYLVSMEKAGFLQRQGAVSYALGPALLRLGALALEGRGVIETAGPVIRELAERISGTVVLGVWGGSAPVVARVERNPHLTTTVSVDVGRTLEPDSAQSVLFAAFRARGQKDLPPNVSERPVAGGKPGDTILVARHWYADGALKVIAVPVVARNGEISATLAVLGFAVSLPDAEDETVIDLLVAAARRIEGS